MLAKDQQNCFIVMWLLTEGDPYESAIVEIIWNDLDASGERDAISALVDCAVPEKLEAFQHILLQFVNQHLGKLNIVVTDLQNQVSVAKALQVRLLTILHIPYPWIYEHITKPHWKENIVIYFRRSEYICKRQFICP